MMCVHECECMCTGASVGVHTYTSLFSGFYLKTWGAGGNVTYKSKISFQKKQTLYSSLTDLTVCPKCLGLFNPFFLISMISSSLNS